MKLLAWNFARLGTPHARVHRVDSRAIRGRVRPDLVARARSKLAELSDGRPRPRLSLVSYRIIDKQWISCYLGVLLLF